MSGQSTQWRKGATSLSSDWSGLSRHLVAAFFPVEKKVNATTKESYWAAIPGAPVVEAPLTEGSIDHTINWNSPFENTGLDQKFGTLSALLQTGAADTLLMALKEAMAGKPGEGAVNAFADSVQSLRGHTSVTKLNSHQVFTGLPPAKISVTAHFRALTDPRSEVHAPVDQLVRWSLPQKLASEGAVATAARGGGVEFYPSSVPQIIGMSYAGMSLLPLVIESVPVPITVPRDYSGAMLSQALTLTLATLTSIDSNDWAAAVAGK